MRRRVWKAIVPAAIAIVLSGAAQAQTFLGIDRYDELEDHGIWSRSNQKALDVLAAGTVLGLAMSEGTETRIGKTAWQAMDAALLSAATTETMKRVFGRPRPAQNPDPTVWFSGSHNRSFPSGETAMISSLVTPFIIQYHEDHPAVWALAALPVYMGRARMSSQGHWFTDVAVGGAIGAAWGWYATQREVPLTLAVSGRSAFIGLHYRF
jgi:undecaprenyl-diphosphatase